MWETLLRDFCGKWSLIPLHQPESKLPRPSPYELITKTNLTPVGCCESIPHRHSRATHWVHLHVGTVLCNQHRSRTSCCCGSGIERRLARFERSAYISFKCYQVTMFHPPSVVSSSTWTSNSWSKDPSLIEVTQPEKTVKKAMTNQRLSSPAPPLGLMPDGYLKNEGSPNQSGKWFYHVLPLKQKCTRLSTTLLGLCREATGGSFCRFEDSKWRKIDAIIKPWMFQGVLQRQRHHWDIQDFRNCHKSLAVLYLCQIWCLFFSVQTCSDRQSSIWSSKPYLSRLGLNSFVGIPLQ